MLLTIEFLAVPAHIEHINLETLPITYSVGCVFVELADKLYNPLYLAKDSLSHRQQQTGSKAGLETNCITLRLPP